MYYRIFDFGNFPEEPRFDWDLANISHFARHKVLPEEAEQALLNDPFDVFYEVINDEHRCTSIGHTNKLRVLLVVWTLRGDEVVRVVTAREGNRKQRTTYLGAKGFGYEEAHRSQIWERSRRSQMVGPPYGCGGEESGGSNQ
ncbi:MAG: BrnT family toxin [Gammaproteobacteria bacterium]